MKLFSKKLKKVIEIISVKDTQNGIRELANCILRLSPSDDKITHIDFRRKNTDAFTWLPSGEECLYNDNGDWLKCNREVGCLSEVISLIEEDYNLHISDIEKRILISSIRAVIQSNEWDVEETDATNEVLHQASKIEEDKTDTLDNKTDTLDNKTKDVDCSDTFEMLGTMLSSLPSSPIKGVSSMRTGSNSVVITIAVSL